MPNHKAPQPSAPAETFTLRPTPSPGFLPRPCGSPAPPGFQPRQGEGNVAARARVIDQVLEIATQAGQRPARNG